MHLMNSMNSKGPKMDTYGTPIKTRFVDIITKKK